MNHARQRLGRLLGRHVTQREMSEMLGMSDGWRHYEAGRRLMSKQLAKHVRLLLRVHECRAELEAIADEGHESGLRPRILAAATKIAGADR